MKKKIENGHQMTITPNRRSKLHHFTYHFKTIKAGHDIWLHGYGTSIYQVKSEYMLAF